MYGGRYQSSKVSSKRNQISYYQDFQRRSCAQTLIRYLSCFGELIAPGPVR
jgi:hypothetical protein